MELDIGVLFESLPRQVYLKIILGISHKELRTFMLVSRRILLKIRNISNKIVEKSKHIFYVQ